MPPKSRNAEWNLIHGQLKEDGRSPWERKLAYQAFFRKRIRRPSETDYTHEWVLIRRRLQADGATRRQLKTAYAAFRYWWNHPLSLAPGCHTDSAKCLSPAMFKEWKLIRRRLIADGQPWRNAYQVFARQVNGAALRSGGPAPDSYWNAKAADMLIEDYPDQADWIRKHQHELNGKAWTKSRREYYTDDPKLLEERTDGDDD